MIFKIVSTIFCKPKVSYLKSLYYRCSEDWKVLVFRFFKRKDTSCSTLSDKLSTSVKDFIKYTDDLTVYQKYNFEYSLYHKSVSYRDLDFLFLELKYPFKPDPTSTSHLDELIEKTVDVSDFVRYIKFYSRYNTKYLFDEVVWSNLIDIIKTEPDFKEISDCNIVALGDFFKRWFNDLSGFSNCVDKAMVNSMYPFSINDTGFSIYVGETPKSNSNYYWSFMGDLLNRNESDDIPVLTIVCLESSLEAELEYIRNSISKKKGLNKADIEQVEIEKKLKARRFSEPCYWPSFEGASELNGESFQVTFNNQAAPLQGLTHYSLTFSDDKKTTEVNLSHISDWPDGSIPFKADNYHETLSKEIIRVATDSLNGNQLTYIHCRSGLGRAGVFRLAVEYARRNIQDEEIIPIRKMVEDYRKHCRYAIQTAEQFQFLHDLCGIIDKILS
jgi:hypothetical protein